MHLKNKPPIFVPTEYVAEIEQLSKAALMDLAWDLVASGNDTIDETMHELRQRIDVVLMHRKQS